MAIVYSQNVIEIAVVATFAGRPHVNVLHLANDEGAQSDATKVRDLANNWQDHIMPSLNVSFSLVRFDWRSLDPDDLNSGSIDPDPAKPLVGGYPGAPLPPSMCHLIHKRTNNRPRGRRDGRMYISGLNESDVDAAGALSVSLQAGWNTALESFVDGVNDDQWGVGGGSGLVVLETTPASRAGGSQPVTIDWRAVTSMVIDPIVGHQRDRTR